MPAARAFSVNWARPAPPPLPLAAQHDPAAATHSHSTSSCAACAAGPPWRRPSSWRCRQRRRRGNRQRLLHCSCCTGARPLAEQTTLGCPHPCPCQQTQRLLQWRLVTSMYAACWQTARRCAQHQASRRRRRARALQAGPTFEAAVMRAIPPPVCLSAGADAAWAPVPGQFSALAAGSDFTCGLLAVERTAVCWAAAAGPSQQPQSAAAGRTFRQLAAGDGSVCGLDAATPATACFGEPPADWSRLVAFTGGAHTACCIRSGSKGMLCSRRLWPLAGSGIMPAPVCLPASPMQARAAWAPRMSWREGMLLKR